jgi:hypothetical protein
MLAQYLGQSPQWRLALLRHLITVRDQNNVALGEAILGTLFRLWTELTTLKPIQDGVQPLQQERRSLGTIQKGQVL